MFLKRIVLHGFKSFADKTEFDFGPGRASIVGPNGCGKSNVLDAVRWVLGEQSAKTLRGHKMIDVVFAGSRSRPPSNFAEVELTFDNSSRFLQLDQPEVSVGRVLYRSGESDYRLNGRPCRLKDVRDLLLDTGVGVDAYSIIEQGRVDSLLQANPVERREIFEEAAGISRYKVRRIEAQRKLERTQNNLLRLNDLVEELEKRLRSVKIAAGKARNYQEYDQRLRELRSASSLAEFHELRMAGEGLETQRDEWSRQQSVLRAELAERDAGAAELDRELQTVEAELSIVEERLAGLRAEASALAERRTQSAHRIEDGRQSEARQRASADECARRADELLARVAEERGELEGLQSAASQDSARVEEIHASQQQAFQRATSSRTVLQRERSEIFEAARRASLLASEQAGIEQQRNRAVAQVSGLARRGEQIRTAQVEIEQRTARLDAALADLTAQVDRLRSQLGSADESLAALAEQSAAADDEVDLQRDARTALMSRIKLLEDMEARREGIDQATRSVLDWRTDAATVVGLVADAILIDDPRVDLLQTILARFERHIVVRNCVEFLAEVGRRGEPAGPVGVLAMDRARSAMRTTRYDEAPGYVAHVLDWVRCSPEMRPLAEYLLGNVLVVDVRERALALADSADPGTIFVTLDGHTIEAGGRMTIGSPRAEKGLISRKSEVRHLRSELDEVESRMEKAIRRRSELERQVEDLRLARDGHLQSIATLQRNQADARTELVRGTDELARSRREADLLAADLAQAERLLAELAQQFEKLGHEQIKAETAQREQESRVGTLDSELQQLEEVVARLSSELTAARVEAGRAVERRTARERSVAELESRLRTVQSEENQLRRQADEAAERCRRLEQELSEAVERCDELAVELSGLDETLSGLRDQRQGLRQRRDEGGSAVRGLHARIEEIDLAQRRVEIDLRETQVRRETLVARVRDELSIELDSLYADYQHAEQDWSAVRAEIDELRGKMSRLGHVNLDAIAELEEITPRWENMVAQRSDLLDSIAQLEALIADLDRESRTRFEATFVEIREHFRELFRKLFSGGKADIVLEDPENPLECGIEIVARPPGKEPQSISLLSGGEKTMTAVALLFAVFRRKPSPFAILDEVDAALDESNVGRFNTIVDEFLDQSQFIVITHHKRTMQSADVLYGVTMEEAGVSKRVSVRFDDLVDASV